MNTVADQLEPRLIRMENKLDTLTDAVVNIARMEERMITLFNRMDAYDSRLIVVIDKMNKIQDRLIEVERSSTRINAMERIMYIVGAAGVSSFFWFLQK